jgi:glycosyltransferase involved in cell wall biosynthesis
VTGRASQTGIVAAPQAQVDATVPALRICMFVYNACANDVRVLKEAASLTAAGHKVQIVAVLDKHTAEREERDDVTIVRIDRRPVHYRLLRATRQVRRRLRLRRAALRRRWAKRKAQGLRGLWSPRLPSVQRLRSRGVSAPRPVTVLAAPFVAVWRAARWRILHRAPALQRRFYRRRAERARRQGARSLMANVPAPVARPAQPPVAIVAPAPSRSHWWSPGVRALGRRGQQLDRWVSHTAYRAVMTMHKPLLYSDYYRLAYAVAMAEPFDVFHAHDLNTLLPAAAAARRTGRPLVYDSHELYPDVSGLSRKERFIWRRIEPRLIRRATHVITVCESIAGELVRRYRIAPPTVLLNCPPAVALAETGPTNLLRARAGLTEADGPVVLYQGGFAPGRGIDALIDASVHLERGVLVLMGWGPIEDDLARQIERLGMQGKVRIIAPVSRAELLPHTAGADVGVIPYQPVGLNNYYTTPNKLFEYIAAGLPIAASAVPELQRFLGDHDVGLTFDPYDPRAIASTINRMLSDAELLAQMRASATAAATVLNWEHEQVKLVRLYQELSAVALPAPRP